MYLKLIQCTSIMTLGLKIVVTGASGFVARNLRKYLAEKNVKLISISRKDFKKFKNETKIISDNYEGKTIIPTIKNSTALIHLVGIGKGSTNYSFNQINVEFTKKIINLCKKSKIKKIIFNSGLGVSKSTTLSYFISKYQAENEVLNSGLDYTIFRPSYILGKNDYLTKSLKQQIKNGTILIPGSGNYSIQPIHIDDVTKIIFKSINDKKFRNKILDLVGSESITYKEYVKLFSSGTQTKIEKIDLEKAYSDAISNPRSKFSVEDLNLLVGSFRGNYPELQRISKISFQSIRDVLKSGSLF